MNTQQCMQKIIENSPTVEKMHSRSNTIDDNLDLIHDFMKYFKKSVHSRAQGIKKSKKFKKRINRAHKTQRRKRRN